MPVAQLRRTLASTAAEVALELRAAVRLGRAGVLPGPGELIGVARAARTGGGAAITEVLAARFGDDIALIDDSTPLTYAQLAEQNRRWVNALGELGAHAAPRRLTIGVMCRNSAPVVIALLGALSSDVRLVFLNTDMGLRQLETVCRREQIDVILHDAEFSERIDGAAGDCRRILMKTGDGDPDRETFAGLLAASSSAVPPTATGTPEMVILTSGSSGVPRGAARRDSQRTLMSTLAGLLEKIPLRRSDVIYLAPPAFHGWGLIATLVGLLSGATLVFDGRFDARRAVDSMLEHRCTVFIAVPTMLKRVMDLPSPVLEPLAGRLRIVGSGGARLEPTLVRELTGIFGHVLHNLYGATELSYITIATPDDLALDPTCAGSPPLGVTVAILVDGRPAAPGASGEIYVRTRAQMSSYTDGTAKESIGGLTRTGDTGYLDRDGRLYVQGRADGMIVSGGENVYPEEVELALQRHPQIADATVFTVADEDFGQRLSAVVAPAPGAAVTAETVREFVGRELSRSRVPREVFVVDEVVRTSTGKVTRAWIEAVAGGTAG